MEEYEGSDDMCDYILSRLSNSLVEEHQRVCAAVGSMAQELKDQGIPSTPTAYLGATISSLDRLSLHSQSSDPPTITALLTLLSIILPNISPALLMKKRSFLSEPVLRILLDEESLSVDSLASGLKCVSQLLAAGDKADWSDSSQLYGLLMRFICDSRLKVRKQAHRCLHTTLESFQRYPVLAPASEGITNIFERLLLLVGGSNSATTETQVGAQHILYVLDVLKDCLPLMASKSITSMLKYFKTLLDLHHCHVTRRITDSLSVLCLHPTREVAPDVLLDLLCSLALSVPRKAKSADDMTATVRLLDVGIRKVYAQNRQTCVVKLPVIFNALAEILATGCKEALFAAMETIKSLTSACIDDGLVKQGVHQIKVNEDGDIRRSGPTIIEKLCATIDILLGYRYYERFLHSFLSFLQFYTLSTFLSPILLHYSAATVSLVCSLLFQGYSAAVFCCLCGFLIAGPLPCARCCSAVLVTTAFAVSLFIVPQNSAQFCKILLVVLLAALQFWGVLYAVPLNFLGAAIPNLLAQQVTKSSSFPRFKASCIDVIEGCLKHIIQDPLLGKLPSQITSPIGKFQRMRVLEAIQNWIMNRYSSRSKEEDFMVNPIESPCEELVVDDHEVLPKELEITNQYVIQDNSSEVTQCDEAYDKFVHEDLKVLQPHDEPIKEEDIIHALDVVNDEVLASPIRHDVIVIENITSNMITIEHIDVIIPMEKVCPKTQLQRLLETNQASSLPSPKPFLNSCLSIHVTGVAIANMKNFKIRGGDSAYLLKSTLKNLADMEKLSDDVFPYRKQLHDCIGEALRAIGPETFLSILPLNLESKDLSEVNVWLFPILKQFTIGGHLSFFLKSIVVAVGLISQKSLMVVDANLNALRSSARDFLSVLRNIFLESSDDGGGYLLSTIGEFASISDKAVVSRLFRPTMKKLADMTYEAVEVEEQPKYFGSMQIDKQSGSSLLVSRAKYLDLAASFLRGLDVDEVNLLLETIKPGLEDGGLIQKKAYKILSAILKDHVDFLSAKLDDLLQLMIKVLPHCHFSAKRHRLDCLYLLLVHVAQDTPEPRKHEIISSFLTEIVLALKEVNRKTRNRAYDILVQIGQAYGDEEKGGKKENLQHFFHMVAGGLAGDTPQMISAAVKGLARLAYEFSDLISAAYNVLPHAFLLLQRKNQTIIKANLGLLKVLVAKSQAEWLKIHLKSVVEGLVKWQDDTRNHFKAKVKLLLEMLIKKCGMDAVKAIKERKDRRIAANNSEDAKSVHSKATATSRISRWNHTKIFSDFGTVATKDSDVEYKKSRGKPSVASKFSSKASSSRLKQARRMKKSLAEDLFDKMEDDPLDLLDRQRTRSALQSSQSHKRKQESDDEVEIDFEGRLVIHEGGRRNRERSSHHETDADSQVGSHLSARSSAVGQRKRKKTSDSGWAYTGSEYASKKADGDVKRKDKLEPYAYWPLDRKMMSRRPEQRAAARKGMASVVKLTKKREGKNHGKGGKKSV
ncbi:hypothetical protein Sjap_018925 [Stephania japonica]|uniref:RRP12-like protein n=1 Tax=Stephania japonica TaxID=461633 RepID=A0AAP0I907_9MAGN